MTYGGLSAPPYSTWDSGQVLPPYRTKSCIRCYVCYFIISRGKSWRWNCWEILNTEGEFGGNMNPIYVENFAPHVTTKDRMRKTARLWHGFRGSLATKTHQIIYQTVPEAFIHYIELLNREIRTYSERRLAYFGCLFSAEKTIRILMTKGIVVRQRPWNRWRHRPVWKNLPIFLMKTPQFPPNSALLKRDMSFNLIHHDHQLMK
jgi:hypothetical protein